MVSSFLHWAGGKGQLVKIIEDHLPISVKESKVIESYHEPFIGGGAVFFYLMSNYDVKKAFISDVNDDLIRCYKVIQLRPKSLINELLVLEEDFPDDKVGQKDFYLDIRSKFNNLIVNDFTDEILKSAYMLFLNKTCFNGLWRVNKKGKFNVGRGTKDFKVNRDNILECHKVLDGVFIDSMGYLDSEAYITKDSLVYLDPPYRPLNKTANFTSYNNSGFDDSEQERLGCFFQRLDRLGCNVLLSNSDPHNSDVNDNFFDDLYNGYNIFRVDSRRTINSNASKRGNIKELLITNFNG